MKTFEITFTGRRIGAIGIFYVIRATRQAETPEAAILALYDEYEHIQGPRVLEELPPKTPDGAPYCITNLRLALREF